jgi:hypothetical protein
MNTINTIARDTDAIPATIGLSDLVGRAGSNVSRPRVVFEGTVYDGTLAHANSPFDAIDGIKDAIFSEFEMVERKQNFEGYTFNEVSVALAAVLNRSDAGVPQPISNDPTVQPSTRIIDVGYDWKTGKMRTVVVPAGEMSLPGFRSLDPKKWQPSMRVSLRHGTPVLVANVLRCDQDAVEGIFGYIKDWVRRNSIYIGQVVDVNFEFLKLTDFQPQNVALTDTLRSKIELFVTGPLQHDSALDERGLPRKTGLFLYGPPGGGKTMAKTTCFYLAARLGAVVVEVDPSLGIEGFQIAAIRTEALLENGHKVVIGMEDMEKLAIRDRAKVLDILDGTSSKGFRRITIGTTNFLEQIDRAMLRPGRFDAVEYCGLPDRSAFEQLVKVLIAESDRGDIDYDEAFPHFEGYSYAFIANAVQIILRSAINRAKGDLSIMSINTADLITAAQSVRGHFDLMQEEVVVERPPLDGLFRDIVYGQVESYLSENDVMTSDYTDYDAISDLVRDHVDSVVEGRLDGAYVADDEDGGYRIRTN